MTVVVVSFNKVKLNGSVSGNIENTWANYPSIRPPTDTQLPDAALFFMETALTNEWWDYAEAVYHKDRFEALGGGGVVTVPQSIIDMFPAPPPPPEE